MATRQPHVFCRDNIKKVELECQKYEITFKKPPKLYLTVTNAQWDCTKPATVSVFLLQSLL